MKFESADVISISAIFIAVVTTIIQYIYESKQEWHNACELLFKSMDSLFTEIKELATKPDKTNHISYQQYLSQRKNLLYHYRKRFFLHKKSIDKALYIISDLMEMPLYADYEELMNKGFKKNKKKNKIYYSFINEIRNYTAKASEALLS